MTGTNDGTAECAFCVGAGTELRGRPGPALSLRWSRVARHQDCVKVLAANVRRCVDGGHG